MKKIILFWIFTSILFETCGDYFSKLIYISNNWKNIFFMFLFYNLMLLAWYFAMKESGQLAITGIIWLLAGQLAVIILGIGYFKETINNNQIIGFILSIVSIILLTKK